MKTANVFRRAVGIILALLLVQFVVSDSALAALIRVLTPSPPTPPATCQQPGDFTLPPSELVITAEGAGQVRLTWVDNATNEYAYEIWRGSVDPSAQEFSYLVAIVGIDVTSFVYQDGLANTYWYGVRAYNQCDASLFAVHAPLQGDTSNTTRVPTPRPTLRPTEEPTAIPAPAASDTPTTTPTIPSTETATVAPTAEVSPTNAVTVTPEPSAVPSASPPSVEPVTTAMPTSAAATPVTATEGAPATPTPLTGTRASTILGVPTGVAVVAGVAVLVGAGWWFLRRRV